MNRVHGERTDSRPQSLSAPSIPSGCGANGERADLGINKVGGERIDSHIRTIALHNEQGSLAVLPGQK